MRQLKNSSQSLDRKLTCLCSYGEELNRAGERNYCSYGKTTGLIPFKTDAI